jgi:hypothetical protein
MALMAVLYELLMALMAVPLFHSPISSTPSYPIDLISTMRESEREKIIPAPQ